MSSSLPRTLFQSAPLHEGRRGSKPSFAAFSRFNPRPCTRGDQLSEIERSEMAVSIRAPARGATRRGRILIVILLFQSAPLHEGRHGWSCWRFGVVCFNPRPCTRGDFGDAPVSQHIEVSIRAPARGATFGDNAGNTCRCFNPRPCTRGDFVHPVVGIKHYGFNPRPCTRGDHYQRFRGLPVVFQSAPLHEGRLHSC